jgi:hypothetical protein
LNSLDEQGITFPPEADLLLAERIKRFLGTSPNVVYSQIYVALITYLLIVVMFKGSSPKELLKREV